MVAILVAPVYPVKCKTARRDWQPPANAPGNTPVSDKDGRTPATHNLGSPHVFDVMAAKLAAVTK